MNTNHPKLRLRGVSKKFVAPRTGHITLAVDDVSLDIASGEFISIVGPSGCGKSTVMNMIAGLDHQTDRKSTRLNSSHLRLSRMPSSA